MDVPTPQRRLGRLKWIAIMVPILVVGLLEVVVYVLHPSLAAWPGRIVLAGVVAMGLVFFFGFVFDLLGGMQDQLARQNRELLALHRAALDIYGELSLETVLQKVVDQVRPLLDARYGAVSVIDEGGGIREFATSGIDPEVRAGIGDPPQGRGLLGAVLNEESHLRLDDLTADPGFSGFPENHPPMRSLLAVPVLCKGPFRGNLYVADKETSEPFTEEDEQALERFATVSAIAIDNAYLHVQVRNLAVAEERALIAREMHDGLAQVLAYVNTKAQAVEELLRKERTHEARMQLDQLAAAARDVYADVREGILALRNQPGQHGSLIETLKQFLQVWQEQSGVVCRLELESGLRVPSSVELQLLRIIQEALANVRKHSRADSVRVELLRTESGIAASVEDDGIGFDPSKRVKTGLARFGLAIMRERAEGIGGSLSLQSEPGKGTRVFVELPVHDSLV